MWLVFWIMAQFSLPWKYIRFCLHTVIYDFNNIVFSSWITTYIQRDNNIGCYAWSPKSFKILSIKFTSFIYSRYPLSAGICPSAASSWINWISSGSKLYFFNRKYRMSSMSSIVSVSWRSEIRLKLLTTVYLNSFFEGNSLSY